jgi:hypothetical protein
MPPSRSTAARTRGTVGRAVPRVVLALVASASAAARAEAPESARPIDNGDAASADRRLSPRNDVVYLSISQIHDDALASRDLRVGAGAPLIRGDGFGLGVFARHATTWIDSDELLPSALVLHRFDLMLGGGARIAPGWSLRGAIGVTYASDLHAALWSWDPFQLTVAALVRHPLGPSDAWMAGVAYSSSSGLYPVLPTLGYVHQRPGAPLRFDALLPHHVRAVYDLTPRWYGALGIEVHGDRWLVRGMRPAIDTRRDGGAIFGELGVAAVGAVHVECRLGLSVDRYRLPDAMTGTSHALSLRPAAFAQLLAVVAP